MSAQHAPMRVGDVTNVRVEGHQELVPMLSIHLDHPMNAGGGVALIAMRGRESDSLARLFAAAPELLEACAALLANAEEGLTNLGAMRAARVAIAKATASAA